MLISGYYVFSFLCRRAVPSFRTILVDFSYKQILELYKANLAIVYQVFCHAF